MCVWVIHSVSWIECNFQAINCKNKCVNIVLFISSIIIVCVLFCCLTISTYYFEGSTYWGIVKSYSGLEVEFLFFCFPFFKEPISLVWNGKCWTIKKVKYLMYWNLKANRDLLLQFKLCEQKLLLNHKTYSKSNVCPLGIEGIMLTWKRLHVNRENKHMH